MAIIKKLPNSVGGFPTPQPREINNLMKKYASSLNTKKINSSQIAKHHAEFEHIHPFLDGNGRIGRAIILKQCLMHNISLILVNNESKHSYYNALKYYRLSKKTNFLEEFFIEQQRIFNSKYKKYFK